MSEFRDLNIHDSFTNLRERYRLGKVEPQYGGFIRSEDGELPFAYEGEILSVVEAETGNWQDERDLRESNGFNRIGSFIVRTDQGARPQNQDVFYINLGTEGRPRLVMGIFDGVGGAENGRLAASAAAVGLAESLRQNNNLDETFLAMHRNIKELAPRGGSTGIIVDVQLDGAKDKQAKRVKILSAGDSRIITIRNGMVFSEGTTTPQNLAQEILSIGAIDLAKYYNHPFLNRLTGSLGLEKTEPEKKEFVAQEGDILVASSDGVGDVVSDFEILELLKRHQSLEVFHRELFHLARNRHTAEKPIEIKISERDKIIKEIKTGEGRRTIGDNITLGVIKIKRYLDK